MHICIYIYIYIYIHTYTQQGRARSALERRFPAVFVVEPQFYVGLLFRSLKSFGERFETYTCLNLFMFRSRVTLMEF